MQDPTPANVARLANILTRAKEAHSEYERTAPQHSWAVWYAQWLLRNGVTV